jgi:hypothetical protein
MRGRYPLGLEAVDKLEGSEQAKEGMKVIMETLTGKCRLQEACARLGISEPRFQQLRQEFLEGGLASLEPGTAGRPAQVPSATEVRVQEPEARLAALQVEYHTAQLREEIGVILPRVGQAPAEPGKKRPRRAGNSVVAPVVGGRALEAAEGVHTTRS